MKVFFASFHDCSATFWIFSIESYIDSFSRFRDEPEYTEPLYPGIRDCLNDLVSLGFSLGIATGKSRRGLLRTLERHNLSELFCVLKTADDGPGKPNPDILLDAIDEVQTIAEKTAMIGDTIYDMIMAKEALVTAIGVSWGYHDTGELKEAGARIIAKDCAELQPALRALWRLP